MCPAQSALLAVRESIRDLAQRVQHAKIIAIDLDSNRIEQARRFGASDGVSSADPDWHKKVMASNDGFGVDVAVEAVGIPETFEMATQIVRPGGHVANVGVHGRPVALRLEVDKFASDHFKLGDMLSAYDTFGRAAGRPRL